VAAQIRRARSVNVGAKALYFARHSPTLLSDVALAPASPTAGRDRSTTRGSRGRPLRPAAAASPFQLCTHKPDEFLDQWRHASARTERHDDLAEDRRAVESERDKPTGRDIGGHQRLEVHRITHVALDELIDGIVVARLGHDARGDTDSAELGLDQLAEDRDAADNEGLLTQLRGADATPTGQPMYRRGDDGKFFLAERLDGEPGRSPGGVRTFR
jgi:hypothetical protein